MADAQQLKLAQKNFKVLCAMLDDNKWNYEKDDENFVITSGARGDDLPIPLEIKLLPAAQIVTLISVMPFEIPKEKTSIVSLAVSVVNQKIIDGNFEINYDSNKMLFRLTSSYFDSLLSKEAFQYMLFVSCQTIDEFNDKFLKACKEDMSVTQLFELFN